VWKRQGDETRRSKKRCMGQKGLACETDPGCEGEGRLVATQEHATRKKFANNYCKLHEWGEIEDRRVKVKGIN